MTTKSLSTSTLGGIIRKQDGKAIEIGCMPDHVHCLARFPARKAVSDMLRAIKSDSSGWVNHERPGDRFDWQTGYGAFTMSQSQVENVRQYIRTQEEHHQRRSFEMEYLSLLKSTESNPMNEICGIDGIRQADSALSGRGIRRIPDPGLAPRRCALRRQPRAIRLSPFGAEIPEPYPLSPMSDQAHANRRRMSPFDSVYRGYPVGSSLLWSTREHLIRRSRNQRG